LNREEIDLNAILVKPLYLGLLINIFVPAVVVGIIYFMEDAAGQISSGISEESRLLFFILMGVAIIDGGLAIYIKHKRGSVPLVRSRESFEEDIGTAMFRTSLICTAITSSISLYGLVIYLAGGTFDQLLFMVFISFVAFQLIRPRHGYLKKVISEQERMIGQGRFLVD
jgi:hypothetical protein